jgi:methylmalonyl-CoA/ethylmalonyl-CoA epimerase
MPKLAFSRPQGDTLGLVADAQAPADVLAEHLVGIDHIAIAVTNLDAAEKWYREALGFRCVERRVLEGRKSGMRSVVMKLGPLIFVLIQGTNPESQVSRFIEHYGQGVQHVAFQVRGIDQLVATLRKRGLEFSTTLVESPELRQAFTRRNADTGLMLEFIERGEFSGFTDENVQTLFAQLEASDDF